jgi:hypothetical protein
MSMRRLSVVAAFGGATLVAMATTLHITPADSLEELRDRLARDAQVVEVVFEEGIYLGSLRVSGPPESNFSENPLLLRAAAGARVAFDGSRRVENYELHPELPGVFQMEYRHPGGEHPQLWEPQTRTRYRLVADAEAVARFPASYTVEENRLLFQTSDGLPWEAGGLLMSAHDSGMVIQRSHVTVQGIEFQNYLVREKESTAIDLRRNHITIEECIARHCAVGYVVTGHNNQVLRSTADDVGVGIEVIGDNVSIENCRLFRTRDDLLVPMHVREDAGIQVRGAARGGVIRGNLCVGFGTGIFLNGQAAPYVVEHNTLVGQGSGQGVGFGATSWHSQQRFRHNIVADYARAIEIQAPDGGAQRDINFNCYTSPSPGDLQTIGPDDLVADPEFVWPKWGDYRLAPHSPCLQIASMDGPAGALPVIDSDPVFGPPREWHVHEKGRDGAEGSLEEPVRTIQYAVDRAGPGDTILIHPGLYPEPVRITRGGMRGQPLVLRGSERWKSILDSNRAVPVMIQVEGAPYVEIHDLEIRWYGSVAIQLEQSPHVKVTGCRIWNGHWNGGRPTGTAVRAAESPGFEGRNNVFFQQEHGFWFYRSPRVTLLNNSCVAHVESAASFVHSIENSVSRYNSFAFQGNMVLAIEEDPGRKATLRTFDSDHNNFGTALRPQPEGVVFDSLIPRQEEPYFKGGSKAIVRYTESGGQVTHFVSMAQWREFSGLDRNSIYADPLYVNSFARDFRIQTKSPNRNACNVIIGATPP